MNPYVGKIGAMVHQLCTFFNPQTNPEEQITSYQTKLSMMINDLSTILQTLIPLHESLSVRATIQEKPEQFLRQLDEACRKVNDLTRYLMATKPPVKLESVHQYFTEYFLVTLAGLYATRRFYKTYNTACIHFLTSCQFYNQYLEQHHQ